MPLNSANCQLENSDFMEYLNKLTERPALDELVSQMELLEISEAHLSPHIHFRNKQYQRNLIYENEYVQLLCICWKAGQRSTIHDHAQSACVVKTVTGIASETTFERGPDGHLQEIASFEYSNDVMGSEDDDIHQISNLQQNGEDLITLHCYSPPLRNMKLYSLDSKQGHRVEPLVADS